MGVLLGEAVGLLDGTAEGFPVGAWLGCDVGPNEFSILGFELGDELGLPVGAIEGCDVGLDDSAALGV